MIDAESFIGLLKDQGVAFYSGVPDSLLKEFCATLENGVTGIEHVPACNEGAAVAIGSGHHLATGQIPGVYLQNSGLGNLVNPLLSLVDLEVYSIPMVLVIGWRAEIDDNGYQIKDEPQHIKQGRITTGLLDEMEVPWILFDGDETAARKNIPELIDMSRLESRPVAIVVRKNSFMPATASDRSVVAQLGREEALSYIVELLPEDSIIVSTTGKISRELYEIRNQKGQGHDRDFLTVGSMGHASQIATGIALAQPKRHVICIDGDGALLMHAGGMASCAACSNLTHIVLNNQAHESVGGQPTVGLDVDFPGLAAAFGYAHSTNFSSEGQLKDNLARLIEQDGATFIEIKVGIGSRKDLGRPSTSPKQNKTGFMRNLAGTEIPDV